MAVLNYQFIAEVYDQDGNLMEGEQVEWSVSPEEAGSMTGDGTLALRRIEGLNEITLTARSARNTAVVSQPYAVSVKPVAPYYRADKIDEDVTGGYTSADFANDLDEALENHGQDVCVLNFNNEGLQWTRPDPFLTIPSFRGREIKYNFPFFSISQMPNEGMACNPSAGTHATYNQPSSNYKVLSLEESFLEFYRPTAMGIVFCSGTKKTLQMTAYYSDGTQQDISFTVNTDKNSFCGFKAPAGSYITSASILADTWDLAMDEMGFILTDFIMSALTMKCRQRVISPDCLLRKARWLPLHLLPVEISNVKYNGLTAEMVAENNMNLLCPLNVTITADATSAGGGGKGRDFRPAVLEQPPLWLS